MVTSFRTDTARCATVEQRCHAVSMAVRPPPPSAPDQTLLFGAGYCRRTPYEPCGYIVTGARDHVPVPQVWRRSVAYPA